MKTLLMTIFSLGATASAFSGAAVPETRDALDALNNLLGGTSEARVFKGTTPWKEPCEVQIQPDVRVPGELSVRTFVNGSNRNMPEIGLASADRLEKFNEDRDRGLVEVQAFRKAALRSEADRRVRLYVQRTGKSEYAFVVRDERWGWLPLPHVEQVRCFVK